MHRAGRAGRRGRALPALTALDAGERDLELRNRPESGKPYPHPVLVLAGRQDATAGHTGPGELIEHYLRATFAVLDRAGHALLHEQPDVVHALVAEWLMRVRERLTT